MSDDDVKQKLGYVTGEHVFYARFEPQQSHLPAVNFAYAPLTPTKAQAVMRRRGGGMEESSRMSVDLIASQVREWDLTKPNGEPVNPRDKKDVSEHVLWNIVEGIAEQILDSAFSGEAEQSLQAFREGRQVSA